jgi:hypothetical protein
LDAACVALGAGCGAGEDGAAGACDGGLEEDDPPLPVPLVRPNRLA